MAQAADKPDPAPIFEGFPPQALQYYADIAREQRREWFEANREAYMTHVIEPAQAFIPALGQRLAQWRPRVQWNSNHTGRGSFKKIQTDVRFNKGRDPYKTYAQMIFWEGPLATKKENSCFIVTFMPDKVVLAAGLKYMEPGTLKAFRLQAAEDKAGARLRSAVRKAEAAGCEIGGEHYKKVPRGIDPGHKNAGLLRHDALYAWAKWSPPPAELHGGEFVDWCLAGFEAMNPLHTWCVQVLKEAARSSR